MRRIVIALIFCFLLTTAVSAAGSIPQLESNTVVSENGSCEVTINFQLHLEEVPESLYFPLPEGARDITLNGNSARTSLSDGVRRVNLRNSVSVPGSYTFLLHYSLPDAVALDDKGQLTLTIHLLAGFSYPIEKMDFSVTLPGAPERRASFVSTYLQESIESMMTYRVDGPTIHCSLNQGLKDHDWLTMRLAVTEEMFPQPIAKKWSMGNDDVAMYALAALALVYWLISLRSLPPKRVRRTTAPEGLTAGELGCVLCGTGVDLTAMVLSWAQMGYILIHVQDSGRVLLHRRMEMGNERSDLENKLFRSLFGRRTTVDGTGYHYAQLCQKASRIVSSRHYTYRRGSGSIRVFRVLCAGVGFLGGICLATAFVSDTALQVLLSGLLGVVGTFCAWQIQNAGSAFFLRKKLPLLMALGCSLLWLLLCAWADEWVVAAFLLVTQWLGGLAAAFGGRRTDAGKQTAAHILGLRRHLCSVPKAQLQQILARNPDYFYALAPYALALGVDKAFARCFGSRQIPGCDYLTTGMDGHLTPGEWNRLLRDAVAALDERQQKLPLDRFLKR